MRPDIRARFEAWEASPLTWSANDGGTPAWVCFRDSLEVDIGPDPDGDRFDVLAQRMLGGRYYPLDAVEFYGRFQDEARPLRPGDRILQRAPLALGLNAWSMAEVTIAERTEDRCEIGYVTTLRHHGKGIWHAVLTRREGELWLTVESTASPRSFWFWVGLPVARYLQLRARRRAIEEFRKVGAS